MCFRPNNLINSLTGEVLHYNFNMIIAADFRVNCYPFML